MALTRWLDVKRQTSIESDRRISNFLNSLGQDPSRELFSHMRVEKCERKPDDFVGSQVEFLVHLLLRLDEILLANGIKHAVDHHHVRDEMEAVDRRPPHAPEPRRPIVFPETPAPSGRGRP